MVKFSESVENSEKPILSIEITPPDRGKSVEEIFRTIDGLMKYNPQYINVTYHQPHVVYEEINNTIVRRPKRKKPGTVGISASIQNRYQVEVVPHFICGGFNKYETEDALIDLNFLGIENILALRGDPAPGYVKFVPEKDGYTYASELVSQISAMNRGEYLENLDRPISTNFCIGVAGYPEKHFEAPNMERDLMNLKKKVDCGADYVITQMFFSFDKFKEFYEKAREMGITVPIIPGIKPITNESQLSQIPALFHIDLPDELVSAVCDARTKEEAYIKGTKYTARIVEKLLDYNVNGVHIYTMGSGKSTKALLEEVSFFD